jgi:hypothetical protein
VPALEAGEAPLNRQKFEMRRLSSRATFFYKRIFPIIWFGFLLLFMAVSLFAGPPSGRSLFLPGLIIPAVMMGFGYFLMKSLIFDLVDEVFDAGDALLVKNSGNEARIALSDIKNINYTFLVSPPRVTLSIRRPNIFGERVTFCAPLRFIPFSTSPIIDDLIERIDAARRT